VFVSRASYLILRDLLQEDAQDDGLWLDISEGADEGRCVLPPSECSALTTTVQFSCQLASLCASLPIPLPSLHHIYPQNPHGSVCCSLLAITTKLTFSQRDRDRAPPLIVLSLPERIWTPEIAWEKDDDGPPPPAVDAPSGSTPPQPPVAARKQLYFSRDECAICMEAFVRGDSVRILPCGHVFHKSECDEWLLKWRKLVC
jgi:hypothetical protein